MKPEENQIRSIVHDVWATQLGLSIDDMKVLASTAETTTITAAIHITGDFRGAIRLESSRTVIRRAASIMFDQPEDTMTREDELDVIGELANVIAGNIKALIPGNNSLSLPTIIDGSDYQISTVDVKTSDDYGFALDGEAMVLTLLEHGIA